MRPLKPNDYLLIGILSASQNNKLIAEQIRSAGIITNRLHPRVVEMVEYVADSRGSDARESMIQLGFEQGGDAISMCLNKMARVMVTEQAKALMNTMEVGGSLADPEHLSEINNRLTACLKILEGKSPYGDLIEQAKRRESSTPFRV